MKTFKYLIIGCFALIFSSCKDDNKDPCDIQDVVESKVSLRGYIDFNSGFVGLTGQNSVTNPNESNAKNIFFDEFNATSGVLVEGICDMGIISCLGMVKREYSRFTVTVPLSINHGYFVKFKDGSSGRFLYYEDIVSTSGGLPGRKILWQYPYSNY